MYYIFTQKGNIRSCLWKGAITMATLRKVGRLQSSVMVTNHITGAREKKYIYGYTEEELEYERRAAQDNHNNISIMLPFKEWANDVLSYKVQENKLLQETKENYDLVLEKHIYPEIGIVHLDRLTPFMLRRCFSKIPGQRTKQYAYTIVKSVLRQAVRDRLIDFNPCDSIDKPSVETKETKIISVNKFKDVINSLEDEQMIYVIKTCWECGIRRGEVAGLRWSDIDYKKQTIAVKRALRRTKKGDQVGKTKSKASVRTLPVTKEFLKEIKIWENRLKELLAEKKLEFDKSDFVFRSKKDISKPCPLNTLTKDFAKICKRLNLPAGTKFHSLRHSHATILAEHDVHAKKLQVRLGHSSAAFTMDRYTHSTAKMQDGITEIVEKNR